MNLLLHSVISAASVLMLPIVDRPPISLSRAEHRIPSSFGYAARMVIGADGNLWLTGPGTDQIGRLTPRGDFAAFGTPALNTGLHGITTGPDGAVWFTLPYPDRIGRITADGSIMEFPVAPGSLPWEIVTGPDGSLWFTESAANRLGRMTPDGVATEIALPDDPSRPNPLAITTGPDGNVWFATSASRRLGRVSPEGFVSEFLRPSFGEVLRMTPGPDGNVWYTGFDGYGTMGSPIFDSKIGRVTPDGQITEFLLPRPDSLPDAILGGPDGGLWFVEAGRIARITTAFELTEFDLTAGRFAVQIAFDREGGLWYLFRDSRGYGVSRFDPRSPCTRCGRLVLPRPARS